MEVFRFVLTHFAQNDKVRRHYKITKCVFFVRHCEQAIRRAWQSINLNANLPLDCHEFARLRFANSRNDKVLVLIQSQPYYMYKNFFPKQTHSLKTRT